MGSHPIDCTLELKGGIISSGEVKCNHRGLINFVLKTLLKNQRKENHAKVLQKMRVLTAATTKIIAKTGISSYSLELGFSAEIGSNN